ncbi:response regulator [Coemansia asiatica]|uniref:Response regulator n=1 Tax=Coemansia asiatica TaxID=1052880 RepID=A0A9W7XFN3_9FUNG|nr:response regulator [Coemansia asiatica]
MAEAESNEAELLTNSETLATGNAAENDPEQQQEQLSQQEQEERQIHQSDITRCTNRRWVLALALLACKYAMHGSSSAREQLLLIGIKGLMVALASIGMGAEADTEGVGSDRARGMALALAASGLALLGYARCKASMATGDALSNLRAERARFSRLLHAHMRLAVNGTMSGIEDGSVDNVAVPVSSIASSVFLIEHIERCSGTGTVAISGSSSDILFLGCLQSIADVLAARAGELSVRLAFALPTPPLLDHRSVQAVFPSATERAFVYGSHELLESAAQPLRHVLLEAGCLLLEQFLQPDDEMSFVARNTENGCAVTYLVCRRLLRANNDSGQLWRNARLTEISDICETRYPGSVWLESRCVLWGDNKLQLAGFDANGQAVASSQLETEIDEAACREAAMAQHNWLFVRLVMPDALRKPTALLAYASGLRSSDSKSPFLELSEFRQMLRGARVVTRAGVRAHRRLLAAIEGYLREAGCAVERSVGPNPGPPSTPGAVAQLIAQKPPAFIIIDEDMDVLRTEFENLRGTLTFSSSTSGQPGASPQPAPGSLSPSPLQQQAQEAIAGLRRRGFTSTVGIVVFVSISAMPDYRDCVRALSTMPHPLPPPVVKIVPKPISERRLLISLRATWETRRARPSTSSYHLSHRSLGSPMAQMQMQMQSSTAAAAAAYFGRDHSALSTPQSTGSEGMYSNLRTVDQMPAVVANQRFAPALDIAPPEGRKQKNSNRPESISIPVDHKNEEEIAGKESPPSPLIEVGQMFAKTLRCATSPREAPSMEPSSDYVSRLDTVAETESDSRSKTPETMSMFKTASLSWSSESEAADRLGSDEQRSAGGGTATATATATVVETDSAAEPSVSQPKSGSIDIESPGISKTRSLLRDKMSLFNRAKQKARNKLRGISEPHAPEDEGTVSAVVPPSRNDATESEEGSSQQSAHILLQPPLQKQKSQQSAEIDVDKPLPALPMSTDEEKKREQEQGKVVEEEPAVNAAASGKEKAVAAAAAAAPESDEAVLAPAHQKKPKDEAAASSAARDRKARLHARLQNASKRLAESQKQAARKSADGKSEASDTSSLKSRDTKKKALSSASSSVKRSDSIANNNKNNNNSGINVSSSGSTGAPRKRTSGSQLLVEPIVGRVLDNSPPIRVLIVEDNLINRSIMERFLRHMHVYYDVASNGEEAIAMWTAAAEEKRSEQVEGRAISGPYHIVFMDIQMPIMDGIAATKHIRGLERQRKIGVWEDRGSVARMAAEGNWRSASVRWQPYRHVAKDEDLLVSSGTMQSLPVVKSPVIIVALTASSLQSDRHAALAAGCNDFLTKPVSLIWLRKKIMEWGCMQALVDHEGWQRWRLLREKRDM